MFRVIFLSVMESDSHGNEYLLASKEYNSIKKITCELALQISKKLLQLSESEEITIPF